MAITAAGIGAVGSVLSGLGSLGGVFGGKSDGIDVSENIRLQNALFRNKIAVAKEQGIHPLYALGAQTGYSPIAGQSSTGGAVSDAMSGIGAAMQSYTQREMQRQKHNADVAYTDMLTQKAKMERDYIGKQMRDSEIAKNAQAPQNDIPHFFSYYRMPDGSVKRLVNPDTGLQPNEIIGSWYHGEATGPGMLQRWESGLRDWYENTWPSHKYNMRNR